MEHLITAFDESFIEEHVLKELNDDYKQCLKNLNLYIKYLKEAKNSNTVTELKNNQ